MPRFIDFLVACSGRNGLIDKLSYNIKISKAGKKRAAQIGEKIHEKYKIVFYSPLRVSVQTLEQLKLEGIVYQFKIDDLKEYAKYSINKLGPRDKTESHGDIVNRVAKWNKMICDFSQLVNDDVEILVIGHPTFLHFWKGGIHETGSLYRIEL